MTSRARWIILSLAILGLGFASYSAWVHYKLMTDANYASPCDISAAFNCSQVYLSQYGSVAGVPVAVFGILYFGLVILVAMTATAGEGKAASNTPGGAYLFAISTVGLAVVLYLSYASWFILKTGCLLCIGTYVAVIGIFLVSGKTAALSVSQLPGRLFRDLNQSLKDPFPVVLFLILAGAVGYASVSFPEEGTKPQSVTAPLTGDQAADFATAWFKQPRINLGIPADGAKVVLVKFNDYMCPGCGLTYAWYKPVLEKFEASHPGAVKVVVKDWPWDKKCNYNSGTMHESACEAAAAVRMARDQSQAKEVEMVEWLYNNQITLTSSPAAVKAGAERILGVKDFDQQYRLKLPEIQKDVADGVALGVGTTPTLYINGVLVRVGERQLPPASLIEMAIQLELNKAAGK